MKIEAQSEQAQQVGEDNSDAEEGEIFSDDEEAAYFPQRIKSRSTTTTATHVGTDQEASGSASDVNDDKKSFYSRRDMSGSNSPEGDSFRSQRRQRSRERERDSEPKSLATLFFEDRDGTPSELSDDAKGEGGYGGKKRGERFGHSSSPAGSRSKRDRDRSARDRGRRERDYHRGKNSHHGRNERERDRDQDSNVDSSEDESSWPQRGSRRKGYASSSYQRGGRRGNYQSKYGQKNDRFGGSSGSGSGDNNRGGGGRQGSWGYNSSGRLTAQEAQAQVENFRKRREKGLSLLSTPNVKPSDNLDQFNYPAPPSWYLDAVEKWEKQQQQQQERGEGGGSLLQAGLATNPPLPPLQAGGLTAESVKPQPLFPPSMQFIVQQPPGVMEPVVSGNPPPHPLPPLMPAQLPPPPPPPHLTGPPLPLYPQFIPPPSQLVHAVPSLFPPVVSGEMNQVSLTVNQASLTVSASPPVSVCGGGQPQGTQLAVVGIGSEEGKSSGGGSGVSTVTISSLSLDVSSKTDRISAVEEDDEDEEVGMKIALETPTPQPSANETKTFSLFQATPSTTTTTEETVEDETGSAPVVEKEEDDVGKSVTEGGSAENNKPQEVSEKEKKEVVSEDGAASSNDLISTSESLEPPVSGVATSSETEQAPTIPSTSEPTPASSETTTAANSDSVTTELKTYSPPPMTLPSSSPAGGCLPEAAVSQEAAEGHHKEPEVAMESEPEEGDSDYDAYLDQLDEEEDGEEPSKSSLVGAIGVSLLQNNPLDEDFPAIDPTNESQPSSNRDVSLKALLAGSFDTSNTKGKGMIKHGKIT